MRHPVLSRPLLAVLTLLAVFAGTGAAELMLAKPAAAAKVCRMEAVKGPDGSIRYVRVCRNVDPGHPGTGNGPSLADCGLDKGQPTPPGTGFGNWYCVGTQACAIKDNIVPLAPPREPAPPGQKWVAQGCTPCGTCGPITLTLILNGQVARPLIVQAIEAHGNLDPPGGDVQHSPDAKAVVQLATWFWLPPDMFVEERGTSAEGLVAVAEPEAVDWDAGDGSDVFTCAGPGIPYTAGADERQGCTHTYTAMSERYNGRAIRRWVVHYELGGAPIVIAGAPTDLVATTDFQLSVVETQVVGGN